MEKSEMSRGYNCVRTFGKLKLVKKGNLSYYYLDKEQSSDDLIQVFGNFHFPYHLFNISKKTELELYQKKGYGKTIDKTWFCHSPINNKPCGVCHPCKSIIEEKLYHMLPLSALKRYELHEKYGEASFYARLFMLRLKIKKQFL